MTMSKTNNLTVLLCLNGDKEPAKIMLDRQGALLRHALDEVNVNYVFSTNQDYDIVHLISYNQYKAYKKYRENDIKRGIPLVFSAFTEMLQVSDETEEGKLKNNKEKGLRPILKKIVKKYNKIDTDQVVFQDEKQERVSKALDIFSCPQKTIKLGARNYPRENYLPEELGAFRKYFCLSPDRKIIISYGSYEHSENLDILETIARIMPEYTFFFFGNKPSLLPRARKNKIANLFYEGPLPEQLYHSCLLSTEALFIPYKYHCDVSIILEAMKARVPIISTSNFLLENLLIDGKTAIITDSVKGIFTTISNISKVNYVDQAEEFASKYTSKSYGEELKNLYLEVLKRNVNKK